MTNQELANRLYELCEKGDSATAYNELYADTVTSTEQNMQGERTTITGLDAVREKSRQFQEALEEMHGGYTNQPTVFGNYIFIEMGMEAQMKGMGKLSMREMARYEVKDGKIIAEEFYY